MSGSTLPVVVISGSVDPDMPSQALALGAAAYLAKPLDPEVLLKAVWDAVR